MSPINLLPAPPFAPLPTGNETATPVQPPATTWINDGNLKATYENGTLLLETGERSDTIVIDQHANGCLNVNVNGTAYDFPATYMAEGKQKAIELHIKSNGGNDNISICPYVMLKAIVESGDGNDSIYAGGGDTRLFGGRGNDILWLGSGTGYAEGNEDNDTLIGGTGNNALYGNNGRDWMYAGPGAANKQSHMDGGTEQDQMFAGNGHTVMNGGRGDDQMYGNDRTTFYTGEGSDSVHSHNSKDLIYAKRSDKLDTAAGTNVTYVKPDRSGEHAFAFKGTPRFIQRVHDDLDLLRSSPAGQQLLAKLDIAAQNGAPILFRESKKDENYYTFYSHQLTDLRKQKKLPEDEETSAYGYIQDGVPGSRADKAKIDYNPSFVHDTAFLVSPPVIQLYHELAHAKNGADGTRLPGTQQEQIPGFLSEEVLNEELQTIGLSTTAPAFDFDNDPATPPTSTNPAPFTENALNQEMGKPLRRYFTLVPKPAGAAAHKP